MYITYKTYYKIQNNHQIWNNFQTFIYILLQSPIIYTYLNVVMTF